MSYQNFEAPFITVNSKDYQAFKQVCDQDEYKYKIAFCEGDTNAGIPNAIWAFGKMYACVGGGTGLTEEDVKNIIVKFFDKNNDNQVTAADTWSTWSQEYSNN